MKSDVADELVKTIGREGLASQSLVELWEEHGGKITAAVSSAGPEVLESITATAAPGCFADLMPFAPNAIETRELAIFFAAATVAVELFENRRPDAHGTRQIDEAGVRRPSPSTIIARGGRAATIAGDPFANKPSPSEPAAVRPAEEPHVKRVEPHNDNPRLERKFVQGDYGTLLVKRERNPGGPEVFVTFEQSFATKKRRAKIVARVMLHAGLVLGLGIYLMWWLRSTSLQANGILFGFVATCLMGIVDYIWYWYPKLEIFADEWRSDLDRNPYAEDPPDSNN